MSIVEKTMIRLVPDHLETPETWFHLLLDSLSRRDGKDVAYE